MVGRVIPYYRQLTMKIYIKIFAFAAIATGMLACTKGPEEIEIGQKGTMNIEVSIAPATTSDQNTIDQSWELGDHISLLSSGGNFTFTGKSAGTISEFTGEAVQLPSSEKYIAVFPSDETYTLDGRSFNVSIPKLTSPIPEELKCALGTGIVSEGKVEIKHATGYLCFTVSRGDISHIIIKSANGEALSGTFKATVASDGSAGLEPVEASDEILIETQALAGTYFVPIPAKTCNGFSISLKSVEGIAEYDVERYLKVVPGRIYDLGTIDENIEWKPVTAPEIKALAVSSGTATVSWSITNFASAARDILEDWSVGIYNDEGCTDLRVSWNLGSMFRAPEGNILSIGGPFSPRFIFSGLEASKDYYVKAWYTDRPEYTSKPLKITTLASEAVTMATGPAKAGDVILCEDFSELVWGGDMQSRAWGYSDENRGNATALNSATGANPVGKKTIDDFEHKFYLTHPTVEMGLFNTLKKSVGNTRLAEWSSISEDKSDGKVCARPGNIKLGASSKTGGIVTPALSAIEGKALLKVTFKGCPYMELVNDPLTASVMVISTTEKNTATIKDYSIVSRKDITFSPELEWKEYCCEVLADSTDRIAISSRRTSGTGNQRLLIDDIKIEVVETYSGTKVYEIKNATDLQSFLLLTKEYTAEETVTITSDIDLEGVELISGTTFIGTLDGGGHSIKNWTSNGASLIKTLGDGGRIKNLNIDKSCSLIPARTGNFGFLAQTSNKFSIVENCVNNADIDLNAETVDAFRIASLVGVSYGTMKNCINNGDITINVSGNATNKSYLGGLVGYANIDTQFKEMGEGYDVAFDGCTNNGDIVYSVNGTVNYLNMGGVAGGTSHDPIATAYFKGHAKGCTNTGKVSYTFKNGGSLENNVGNEGSGNYTNVGGVFGYWEGSLEECTNRGDVSLVFPTSDTKACASRPAVAGVCAFVMQKMTGCDNYGKVYMKGSSAGGGEANAGNGISAEVCAGGVVAQIGAKTLEDSFVLSDCHNYGELDFKAWMASGNGTGFNLGGVAGYCGVPAQDCSNNAKMTAESKGAYLRLGGVIGKTGQPASKLTNNGELEFTGIRTSGTKQIGSELSFGGVVGSYSVSLTDSKNARNMTVTIESSDNGHAQALIGGVVGGKSSGILDKVYNEAAVTVNQNAVKSVVFGGVASWITGSVKITEAKNTGEISFNTVQMTGQLWCGGIAGYMDGEATMSGCTNDGPVSVVAQTSLTGQSFFGGVLGARADKNVTFNECVNKKTLTVKIPSSGTNDGFYYFGGVVGANKGHTYSNCANYGDIIYEGAAKIRIGGIASYTNKVATGVVRCNITAKCTGYDYSEIGGVISYTSGSEVKGAKFEGTIDTSNSTKKVYTGGIIGKMAGEGQKYNDCMFKGSLIGAEGNNVPGLYAGGLQNNNKTNVFGNTTKCVVAKGSLINGVEVTTLTKENLVSQASNDGTYTSSATLTNIVIE